VWVLVVCLWGAVVVHGKEFECKGNDDKSAASFVEVGADKALQAKLDKEFKGFASVLPLGNGGIGWKRLELNKFDINFRFKFAEKVKNDKTWAVKFDVFNSNVPKGAKEMSHTLTKFHNNMGEKRCKDKTHLATIEVTLHEWMYRNFEKGIFKVNKYGSDKVKIIAQVGISARVFYDTEAGTWLPGKTSDVKLCMESIKIKQEGAKTLLGHLLGGLVNLLSPLSNKIIEWAVTNGIREKLYCGLVDKPNSFLAGMASAKSVAAKQIETLEKCAAGGCSKDFNLPATKELLAEMKSLKHGMHMHGALGLKNQGTSKEQLVMKVGVDMETKTDSMVTGMLVNDGLVEKKNPKVTEQLLQATQWIAASHLSHDSTPEALKKTAVRELYDETYTSMAKAFLKKFAVDPKMAGLVQSGMDAIYDSQTNVMVDLNGVFSILPPKAAGETEGTLNVNAPRIAMNVAIPLDDPMRIPMDLVLNRPVDQWKIGGKHELASVSGIVGLNISDSKFDGQLTKFVDAYADAKDAETKAVVSRSNKLLGNLLKKGARFVFDAGRKSPSGKQGLSVDKNFLRFHGGIEFDAPARLDQAIIFAMSEIQKLQADVEALAAASLARSKKKKANTLFLELMARRRRSQRALDNPGKETAPMVDLTGEENVSGDWEGQVEKATQWAKANPIKAGSMSQKCLMSAPSFLEVAEGPKMPWWHKELPRLTKISSGANAGKKKCGYLFQAPLSGDSAAGAKHIVVQDMDFVLNTQLNKEGNEMHVWVSTTGKAESVDFESYKAVVRQCRANAASQKLFPRIHLVLDNFKYLYDKAKKPSAYGYAGSANLKMRVGMAVSLKLNAKKQWVVQREDVVSCVPEEKGDEFWKLSLQKIVVSNIENIFTGERDSFTFKRLNGDARGLLEKYARDGLFCYLKHYMKSGPLPELLSAMNGMKVGEYGEPGMKLAFGMKLKGKKEMQKKNEKNLKIFLKANFQMVADAFVHTVLRQSQGAEKVKSLAAEAKDAFSLLKAYSAELIKDEKTKAMGVNVHRAATMLFGGKHNYDVSAHGGFEYIGQSNPAKVDHFAVNSNKIMVSGETKEGHVLFSSLLLPVEAVKTLLSLDSGVEPNKFVVSSKVEVGAKNLHVKGPSGAFIEDMMAMVNQGKFKEQKAWAEYILMYLKHAGIDGHVYLGDRSKPEKPGFFINKRVASGAFDFHFKGPADVTQLANFAMATPKIAQQLVKESKSGREQCVP
jgi:hypothetical protein